MWRSISNKNSTKPVENDYTKYNCKSNYGRRHQKRNDVGVESDFNSPFVDLPELVGERICTFLGQGDLLTLRLVCRGTKNWVEAPRNISKITIDLRRPSHLERLLRPRRTAIFTNFRIRMENLSLSSQTYLFMDFASVFGPRMKVLKITSPSGFYRKIDLLLKCPSLEVVQISDLNLRNVSPADMTALGVNFANYQVFELDDLTLATSSHVASLIRWITTSQSLTHVRLPYIQFENGQPKLNLEEGQSFNLTGSQGLSSDDVMKQFCRSGILSPLMHSLKGGAPRLKSIDVERICLNFDNDSGLLQELAGACYKNGVRIRNVPFGQLYPKTSPGASSAEILGTIESCRGFHLGKINVRNLVNMKSLTCSVGFAISNGNNAINYAQELDFPSLEVLDLNIFALQETMHRKVVVALLATPRPAMKKLAIAWNLNSTGYFPVAGCTIGRCFPCLRSLELVQWGADWNEFQDLFAGLSTAAGALEELKIKDCKALSDGVFSKQSRSASTFYKLTKLKKLKIRCYDRGVTDVSLSEAFSILPLRSLSINFIGESSISLRGLSALNRLPFKNSIQYLHLQLETGTSESQVRKVTGQFGNLKNCIID